MLSGVEAAVSVTILNAIVDPPLISVRAAVIGRRLGIRISDEVSRGEVSIWIGQSDSILSPVE